MEESYATRRIVIVGGSLIALYFVDFLIGHLPAFRPAVDALAGYGIGILVHKYWGS